MKPSENFARQHAELAVLAEKIEAAFSSSAWPSDVASVARMVAQFTGKLSVHNAMETEALYPRLLTHSDESVRTRAAELKSDLTGIYDAFGKFMKRWQSVDDIRTNPDEYRTGVEKLFAILRKRLARENSELYPLADAHLS